VEILLEDHPDACFNDFILTGIQFGFRIGFNHHGTLKSSVLNIPSKVPSVISEYLNREVCMGRMIKLPPYFPSPWNSYESIGKWHLIVDLSSPDKASVNNEISESLSSLSYSLVDHLSALVLEAGRRAFLTKADIIEAYRMLPVHPQDQHLLGVYREGSIYIDQSLPFGLGSA